MKATGIIRNIDELGRIVIPKEIRRSMAIESDDPMEIFVEGDGIVLRKYEPACVFCGSCDEIVIYRDKRVCASCVRELSGN